MPRPGDVFVALLSTATTRTAQESILDRLSDALPHVDEQLSFVRAHVDSTVFAPWAKNRLLLRAADLGDCPAFDRLLDEFAALPSGDASRLLRSISRYPEKNIADRVIDALKSRMPPPDDVVAFAHSLLHGATHVFDDASYSGGATRRVSQHRSFPDFLALVEEWRVSASFDVQQALAMTTLAAQHRVPGALESLKEMSVMVIRHHSTRGYENPLNGGIKSAIEELARYRSCLDLPTAIQLANSTDSNALIGALSHIGAIGTRAALERLIARSKSDHENHHTILGGIEAISGKLGLKVVRSRSGYEVVP